MTSHAAPLGPDGDTVALEKAVELDDYAAQDLSSSTGSSRIATTIPYASDFFCDG